jgi:gluconate 2-dehydrogenase gamma chain
LGLAGAAGLQSVSLSASSAPQGGEVSQEARGASASNSKPELPGLTARQTETLGALAEQIIPKDKDPGARDAGVLHYLDRILAGDQASKQPLYAAGLEGVDQTSQLMFGRDFVLLSFQEQTTVLKAIEQGQSPGEIWKTVSSQEFFEMLWNHVLEGFYGPPEEGGNKNYASWKMVGFPPHSGTM